MHIQHMDCTLINVVARVPCLIHHKPWDVKVGCKGNGMQEAWLKICCSLQVTAKGKIEELKILK